MYGLVHFVIQAERDGQQHRVAKVDDRSYPEAQVWLWCHKAFFVVAGVLILLIIGGKVV